MVGSMLAHSVPLDSKGEAFGFGHLGRFAGQGREHDSTEDAASPHSIASCDTEEASVIDGPMLTPVKNTFIHYDCSDQPDYRPCKSGPAKIDRMMDSSFFMGDDEYQQEQHFLREERPLPPLVPAQPPVWLPPPAHSPPPPVQQPRAAARGGGTPMAKESALSVKNTFIHFDIDMEDVEQPDYRPAKSGPAKLFLSTSPEEPAWIPISDENASQFGEEPGVLNRRPVLSGGLPSRGSSGHTLGTCRPCAHIWKADGCSKGFECSFCHLCDQDDFRRKRRQKLERLKSERAANRKMKADAAPQDDARQSPPLPEPDHVQALLTSQGLAPGELSVSYRGAGATVQWAVDLRRLRSQHRCGLSRRLTLNLGGREEVPFVFFISPSAAESVEAATASRRGSMVTFKQAQASASMQLKCMDASALVEDRALLSVAFSAGDLPARQASPAHDFALESVCKLPPHEDAWDLAAATGQGMNCCVLRAELELLAHGMATEAFILQG